MIPPQGVPFDNRAMDLMWGVKKGVRFIEKFNREALTPTGFLTLYTNVGTGTEVTSMVSGRTLQLATGAVAGDDNDCRISGFTFTRGTVGSADAYLADPISSWEINILFFLTGTTLTEGFIGIMYNNIAAITDLPTTAKHMGLFWDASAQANFRLTSANGTTQVNTDSTQALSGGEFRLRIIWNANTGGSITLFSPTANFTTQLATVAVTAFEASAQGQASMLHFFIQTETTAARTLSIDEWSALPT